MAMDGIQMVINQGNSVKTDETILKLKHRMVELAVKGLASMYEKDKNLFCLRISQHKNTLLRQGLSLRYTLICLLGLHRANNLGVGSPFSISGIFKGLKSIVSGANNIGDLGLYLWNASYISPSALSEIYLKFDLSNALECFKDARQARTEELSWFLIGLVEAYRTETAHKLGFMDLARNTYRLLLKNYGGSGIFCHQGPKGLEGKIRKRIGTFADQVYPILAFSMFGRVFREDLALQIASHCADALCRNQGPLGQWWWHYDSRNGKVVGYYPAYSVHQDSMAPMALYALQKATGKDYAECINRGLLWVDGNNELSTPLIEEGRGVIWRSFYTKKNVRFVRVLTSLVFPGKLEYDSKKIRILRECRPYHLGWILYAFGQLNDW